MGQADTFIGQYTTNPFWISYVVMLFSTKVITCVSKIFLYSGGKNQLCFAVGI